MHAVNTLFAGARHCEYTPLCSRARAQRHRAPKARENFGLLAFSIARSRLHTHEEACDDADDEHTVETVRLQWEAVGWRV